MSVFADIARPDLAAKVRPSYAALGQWTGPEQLPLVYSPHYNVRFGGLEKLHPFDSCKFAKVVRGLEATQLVTLRQFVAPSEVSLEELRVVHTEEYLHALHTSKYTVAQAIELPAAAFVLLPNSLVQRSVVRPMRYHTAGTMLAAALALEHGWAINIGGGAHHAYWEGTPDGGWCLYSDLTLAMYRIRKETGGAVRRMLIIDVDVHQGNGHARDKQHFGDTELHILDAYNEAIWPQDTVAKAAIDTPVTFGPRCRDEEYLPRLEAALDAAFAAARPDMVFYNAGTDVLDGDPLGGCCISPEGILRRDEMVWGRALAARAPIVMALSGGYKRQGHTVITDTIANLLRKFGLTKSKGRENGAASKGATQ